MENVSSVSELVKSISVLDAIIWIDESLKQILPKTIHRCFEKANFSLDSNEIEELNQNKTFFQNFKYR